MGCMMVSKEHEPKLCPDCPRKSFLNMVRIQSYTTTPPNDTVVKQCARLRALDLPNIPKCPYFSEDEKMTNFFDCKSEDKPPMVDITYFPHQKAKQIDPGPKGLEWMRKYVQKKLLASGVIPEDEANPINPFSIASHIIHEARRQPCVDFLDGEGIPAIRCADFLIEQAIRFPPDPITRTRFSLKAFIQLKK